MGRILRENCTACAIVPFLRGSATDLNFPFALAIITVILTQVYGAWAFGPGYFSKFFQVKQLVSGGIFGMINFAVGILEVDPRVCKNLIIWLPSIWQYFCWSFAAFYHWCVGGSWHYHHSYMDLKYFLVPSRHMYFSCWLQYLSAVPLLAHLGEQH